jgi:hypothetical protein
MVKPDPQTQPQQFVGSLVGGAILKKVIDVALDKALDKVVKSPSLPVEQQDAAPIKEVVKNEVLKEIGPVWENETNQEPLWRSKVLWTSVGTVVASAAGIYTMVTGDNRAVELVAMATTAVTGIGTIISRLSTGKALGR